MSRTLAIGNNTCQSRIPVEKIQFSEQISFCEPYLAYFSAVPIMLDHLEAICV
jgi:hypothetical protein